MSFIYCHQRFKSKTFWSSYENFQIDIQENKIYVLEISLLKNFSSVCELFKNLFSLKVFVFVTVIPICCQYVVVVVQWLKFHVALVETLVRLPIATRNSKYPRYTRNIGDVLINVWNSNEICREIQNIIDILPTLEMYQ